MEGRKLGMPSPGHLSGLRDEYPLPRMHGDLQVEDERVSRCKACPARGCAGSTQQGSGTIPAASAPAEARSAADDLQGHRRRARRPPPGRAGRLGSPAQEHAAAGRLRRPAGRIDNRDRLWGESVPSRHRLEPSHVLSRVLSRHCGQTSRFHQGASRHEQPGSSAKEVFSRPLWPLTPPSVAYPPWHEARDGAESLRPSPFSRSTTAP